MAKLTPIFLAVPLALTSLAAPAIAQDAPNADAKSVVVRYDDLNLSTDSGRDRLKWRVNSAIRTVCDSRPHYRQSLSDRALAQKCEDAVQSNIEDELASLISGSGGALADRGQMVVAGR